MSDYIPDSSELYNCHTFVVIRSWMLQHSMQHNLKDVVNAISSLPPFEIKEHQRVFARSIPPIVPALAILRKWHTAVETNVPPVDTVLTVLHNVCCHACPCVPLSVFMGIDIRMKLLLVLKALCDDDDDLASQYFTTFFPSWSQDVEDKFKQDFKIDCIYHVQKFRTVVKQCRCFVSRIVRDPDGRKNYFSDCYKDDREVFVNYVGENFNILLKNVSSSIPPTFIDQILNGFDPPHSTRLPELLRDPVINGFLEGLKNLGQSPQEWAVQEYLLNALSNMNRRDMPFVSNSPFTSRDL